MMCYRGVKAISTDNLFVVLGHLRPCELCESVAAVCKEWSDATGLEALWAQQIALAVKIAQAKLPHINLRHVINRLEEEVAGRTRMGYKVDRYFVVRVFDVPFVVLQVFFGFALIRWPIHPYLSTFQGLFLRADSSVTYSFGGCCVLPSLQRWEC